MKPHEETWAAGERPYGKGMQVEVRDASGRHICVFHSFDPSSDRARQRRARFVAAAPAMARALLAHVKSCAPCRGSGRVPFRGIGPVPCEACALDRTTLKEAGVLE
jgi:hypothetical protein